MESFFDLLKSDFYYQMGTFAIPKVRDLSELKQRLLNEYRIEIPTIDWNGQHFIRLSIQGYNSEDDIQQLVNALARLLPTMAAWWPNMVKYYLWG